MSSKKELRRQARRRQAEKPRLNGAKIFIAVILGALLAVAAAALILDSSPEGGRPGQVWSAEHQHWH